MCVEMQRKIIHRTKGGRAAFQGGGMRPVQLGKESEGERVATAVSHFGFSIMETPRSPLRNLWRFYRLQKVSPAVLPACSTAFPYFSTVYMAFWFLLERTLVRARGLCAGLLPLGRSRRALGCNQARGYRWLSSVNSERAHHM